MLEKNLIYKVTQLSEDHPTAFLALFNNNQFYWTHILTDAIEKMQEHNEVENKNELNIRVYDWLNNGKISNCSLTLCKILLNRDDIEELKLPNHPKNIHEFMCCYEFLNKFPEAKARLAKMKNLNHEWETLVNNWSQLEIDYENDIKNNTNIINEYLEKLTLNSFKIYNSIHKM